MRVEVHLYGFVRDVIASSVLSVDMPAGSTLRDLLNESIRRSGERLRDRLFTNPGDLETNVRIFVGANQSATVEQAIPDEENGSKVEIFVLSATAGG